MQKFSHDKYMKKIAIYTKISKHYSSKIAYYHYLYLIFAELSCLILTVIEFWFTPISTIYGNSVCL